MNEHIDNHVRVLRAVEKHTREAHQVCGVEDIQNITGLSRDKCEETIEHLLGNRLVIVHGKSGGKGLKKLYLPKYMWDNLLRSEKKPTWVDEEYSFKEEEKLLKEIRDKTEELNKFAQFKRLLYGIGPALEEAVTYSLDYLQFEGVKHLGGEDEHDVEFIEGDRKVIIEVGGSSDFIRKDKPKDLTEWMKKAALKDENKNLELEGMLLVNHYNDTRLLDRAKVFSDAAKRLLRVFKYKVCTTSRLFELVKDVHNGKIEKDKARKKILRDEKLT